MLSFESFMTEAKVTQANLDKVAEIFKRIIEKRLSTKLFRFGGPKGFTQLKNGIGILYFYNRNKAIRLNYIKGEIKSLTLWKAYKLGQKGDFTVDLGGMGLMQAGKKLIDVIKSPAAGVIKTYGELVESSFLAEAKRVSPSDFYEIVNNNLPTNFSINSVSWGVMSDIAIANDIQIPTVVRTNTKVPGTKGANTRFDLTKLLSQSDIKADPDKPAKSSEVIYYAKITAQDPHTGSFMSVKGDKKAEAMLKTMVNAVQNPNVEKEMKDPDSLFGIMRNLTQVVARGARNSLIVYGGPGTGKTHTILKTVQEEGLQKNKDWFIVKGKVTTSALYQTLFMHRKNGLLIFDDADSMWGDAEATNILKAALDSYEDRTISWLSPRTTNVSLMSDDEKEDLNDKIDDRLVNDPEGKTKLPSEFNFNGRIIFISNLPYEKFDTAVLNRSAKIDMTLTQEQVFHRMRSILPNLGDPAVPIDIKESIMDFLEKQSRAGQLQSPASMRTYVAAEDLYRSGMSNWQELLDFV